MTTRFALNPTGDALAHPESTVVYGIEGGHVSPNGEAVLHLAVASGQPEPSSLASPLLAMTSTANGTSPFGWHAGRDAGEVLAVGATRPVVVSWVMQNASTVIRRVQSGEVTIASTGDPQLAPDSPMPSFASQQGAPLLAQGGAVLLGTLYQSTSSSLSFRPTYSESEGAWLERMLWYHDEFVVPSVAPPPPPGSYSWIGVSASQYDPTPLRVSEPTSFYQAGSDSSHGSYGICVTWYQGGQRPGKYWVNGGCAFDPSGSADGGEAWLDTYKV